MMLLPAKRCRYWPGSVRHVGRPGIALIAVDLDGTLLTSERVLAPEGVRSLRQAYHRGVHVVISTTRNPVFQRTIRWTKVRTHLGPGEEVDVGNDQADDLEH